LPEVYQFRRMVVLSSKIQNLGIDQGYFGRKLQEEPEYVMKEAIF
jgi:hypothetical protein